MNVVVSASAGTGKTWLLIARLLRLLLAGNPPSSILAITFTEKASAEILERLRLRLQTWTHIGEEQLLNELAEIGIPAPSAHITAARLLYGQLLGSDEDVQVVTFHSFCAELLRHLPFDSEAPIGFEILSETWELRQTALKQLYINAIKDASLFAALQTLTTLSTSLNNTEKALDGFLNYANDWRSFTEGADEPAEFAAERLHNRMGGNLDKPIILSAKLKERLSAYADLLRLADRSNDVEIIAAINSLTEDKDDIEVNEQILSDLKLPFFTDAGKRRSNTIKISKSFADRLNEHGSSADVFAKLATELATAVEEIEDRFLAAQTLRINTAWYTAGSALLDIYEQLKRNRQALDFSDLEWFAGRLAQTPPAQYYLSKKIRHVLIDEFQDTNPSQWRLLEPLLEEMASQDSDGSLFIVGDVKQSIYGFRRANPQLQVEVGNWLVKNMNGKRYTMDKSRRSSPEIINLVNQVFTNSAYRNQLSEFREHNTTIGISGAVKRLPFYPKTERQEVPAWREILEQAPAADNDPSQFEAQAAAAQITALINQPTPIHISSDQTRQANYGDVLILLRTRKHIGHFEEALRQVGIPYISSAADSALESSEVKDVLALLSFLLEPHDNLSLAQVLRSPIFAAADADLTTLAETVAQNKSPSWFDAIGALRADAPLWKRCHRLLSRWLNLRDAVPTHDLLDDVYHKGELIQRYRMSVPIEEADFTEEQLSNLLNYALEFDSGRYPDIRSFLLYIEKRAAYYASYASQQRPPTGDAGSGSNHVRILTIHQAKGLEAPIVFLADCGKHSRPKSRAYNALVVWPGDRDKPTDFVLLPPSRSSDDHTAALLETRRQREDREENNLLYVAITRARQYLFVSGSGNADDSEDNPDWYHAMKPYLPETTPPVTAYDNKPIQIAEPQIIRPPSFTLPKLISELNPSGLSESRRTAQGDAEGQMRGIVIHKALELLMEGVSHEETLQCIETHIRQAGGDDIKAWVEQAHRLTQNPDLKDLFDDSAYRQTFNEINVSFMHCDRQCYGTIDRLCLTSDSAWLVDYKSHARADKSNLRKKYREQLRAYAIGISMLYPGFKIRASLLLTDSADLINYDFNRDDLTAPLAFV